MNFSCLRRSMVSGLVVLGCSASAQESSDLAKQLSNPVASLISIPYQLNYDDEIGVEGTGERLTLNVQPVVPISLNADWNLISRTIVPFVRNSDVTPGVSDFGVGDIVQSLFFSPKQPTDGGLIWGVGPVFLLPTGETGFTADQFAAGLTGVALRQSGPWTFGALANHLWDVGGDGTDIDATFLQPFVSYTTPDAWTFSLNTEATYDWVTEEASVPVNVAASKVTRLGGNLVSIGGGLRYWADSPSTGPDGWGARLTVTFLYPR